MQIKNIEIEIVRADISELEVAAIVNPASPGLGMASALALAIKEKGGAAIEAEAHAKSPCPPGEVVVTTGGTLKARKVIHAVALDVFGRTDEHIVRRALANALCAADNHGLASVALPALGCGPGGLSTTGAAKITAQEILKFCRLEPRILRRIIVCLADEEAYRVFGHQVRSYIDHIQEHLGQGPYLTVDILIELPQGLVVIERTNPPYGLALPGGFVDYGESLEEAAQREAKEETSLDLTNLRQMHTFSKPDRDPRFHTVSTVFIAQGHGEPRAGDDAGGLKVIPYSELINYEYAFDHKEIILRYLAGYRTGGW